MCRILQKPTFPKKGVGKFSKKLHFWNHKGVSFRVVCFVCFQPSDPFQRTVLGKVKENDLWCSGSRIGDRLVEVNAQLCGNV